MPAETAAAAPGAAEADYEARAAFQLELRSRGVRDLAVLRAVERVPRQLFAPPCHAALAARDVPLPIEFGQTLSPAWLVARMVEALALAPHHRVLQVGAGSGYATAVVAQLCAAVLGVERIRGLAAAAAARLATLGCGNAEVRWGDGAGLDACLAPGEAPFDRVLVHACVPGPADVFLARLANDGVLVCAREDASGQRVVRIGNGAAGPVETAVCACRLPLLRRGLARSL